MAKDEVLVSRLYASIRCKSIQFHITSRVFTRTGFGECVWGDAPQTPQFPLPVGTNCPNAITLANRLGMLSRSDHQLQ